MDKEDIKNKIKEKVVLYAKENDLEMPQIDYQTRLMGTKGLFDSMDLVAFIVEVEEYLEEITGSELILTDEKAMSRRTSPFINIDTLADYIFEKINE